MAAKGYNINCKTPYPIILLFLLVYIISELYCIYCITVSQFYCIKQTRLLEIVKCIVL